MSKTEFSIKFTKDTEVYKIKIVYAYRRGWNGEVYTTCLLFIYSENAPLPTNLNLQTARAAGFARCSPVDQFSKDIGRKIVLARAMEDADLGIDIRTQVWEQYHDGKYNK